MYEDFHLTLFTSEVKSTYFASKMYTKQTREYESVIGSKPKKETNRLLGFWLPSQKSIVLNCTVFTSFTTYAYPVVYFMFEPTSHLLTSNIILSKIIFVIRLL